MITWRDDDVLYHPGMEISLTITDYFPRFVAVDELLKQYGVKHTIAVLAEGIDHEPEWVDYIKQGDFDIELHGWEHLDLTQHHDKAEEYLTKSLAKIETTFGVRPTVWFPPWNKTDDYTTKVAESLGLTVSPLKVSLGNFVARPDPDTVINFHYWADEDTMYLEDALRIVRSRGWI